MREVQSSDAKARLPQLLVEVEQGETVFITRHGWPIARLVPEIDRTRQRAGEAIAAIKELRKTTGRVTVEEILSSIHEGHKY